MSYLLIYNCCALCVAYWDISECITVSESGQDCLFLRWWFKCPVPVSLSVGCTCVPQPHNCYCTYFCVRDLCCKHWEAGCHTRLHLQQVNLSRNAETFLKAIPKAFRYYSPLPLTLKLLENSQANFQTNCGTINGRVCPLAVGVTPHPCQSAPTTSPKKAPESSATHNAGLAGSRKALSSLKKKSIDALCRFHCSTVLWLLL